MDYKTLLQDCDYTLSEIQEVRNMMTDKNCFRFDTAYKIIGALVILVAYCHKDYKDTAEGLYNECIRRAELLKYPLSQAEYELLVALGVSE